MLLALLISAAAQASCPVPTTANTLTSAIATAEAAYEKMNLDAFNAHVQLIATTLACMGDILGPENAADVHRISALSAYIRKQHDATKAAFQAELTIRPNATLSKEVAPTGNLLRNLFETAGVETGSPTDLVVVPADHLLKIDGQPADARPVNRPAVVQFIDTKGQVIWTALVEVGEPMPDWFEAGAEAMPQTEAEPPSTADRRKFRRRTEISTPLLLSAGGAAVASASLYAAALIQKRAYTDPDNIEVQTMDDLQSLRQSTNAMAYTSIGLGAVAVGLGACAVIEVRW